MWYFLKKKNHRKIIQILNLYNFPLTKYLNCKKSSAMHLFSFLILIYSKGICGIVDFSKLNVVVHFLKSFTKQHKYILKYKTWNVQYIIYTNSNIWSH